MTNPILNNLTRSEILDILTTVCGERGIALLTGRDPGDGKPTIFAEDAHGTFTVLACGEAQRIRTVNDIWEEQRDLPHNLSDDIEDLITYLSDTFDLGDLWPDTYLLVGENGDSYKRLDTYVARKALELPSGNRGHLSRTVLGILADLGYAEKSSNDTAELVEDIVCLVLDVRSGFLTDI